MARTLEEVARVCLVLSWKQAELQQEFDAYPSDSVSDEVTAIATEIEYIDSVLSTNAILMAKLILSDESVR